MATLWAISFHHFVGVQIAWQCCAASDTLRQLILTFATLNFILLGIQREKFHGYSYRYVGLNFALVIKFIL